MKRQALIKLIDQLENEVDDQHFRMNKWLENATTGSRIIYRGEEDIPYCRTAGCIAGTLFLKLPEAERKRYARTYNDLSDDIALYAASNELGLSPREATELFTPNVAWLYLIKREHAIRVLKNILENHAIDWNTAGISSEFFDAMPVELVD